MDDITQFSMKFTLNINFLKKLHPVGPFVATRMIPLDTGTVFNETITTKCILFVFVVIEAFNLLFIVALRQVIY
jgi:hypothetical protein